MEFIKISKPGKLFEGIAEDSYVYFVHSYYLQAERPKIVTATTEYVTHIHASVEKGNVYACQFHPERKFGCRVEDFEELCVIIETH